MTDQRPSVDEIAAAVIGALPEFSLPERRAALLTYRLLANGTPVTIAQISAESGVAAHTVEQMLAKRHGVQRNGEGAVVGFWGLTLRQTKHSFRIDGRQLYTWCAWDTLFLPPLLGEPADVASECPITGRSIELKVAPAGVQAVRPDTTVLSFLLPDQAAVQNSLIDTFCCYVHFFASREAAEAWISKRPGTFIVGLEKARRIGLRRNALLQAGAP